MAFYFRQIITLVAGFKGLFLLNILVGLFGVVSSLTFVYLSKELVDSAVNPLYHHRLVGLSFCLCLTLLVDLACGAISSWLVSKSNIRLKSELRSGLFESLVGFSDLTLKKNHSGEIMNMFSEDIRIVGDVITNNLPVTLITSVKLAASSFFLYQMSPALFGLLVFVISLCLLLGRYYIVKLRHISLGIRDTEADIQVHIQENIQHATLMKTMEQENRMIRRLNRLQCDWRRQVMRRVRLNTASRTFTRAAFAFGYITAFLWSVHGLAAGSVTFGMMTAFLQLLSRIQQPLYDLALLFPPIIQATTSLDRINTYYRESSQTASPEKVVLSLPVGIEVKNMTFAYSHHEPCLFSGFSCDFPPGSRTVILGESGAGKSTLVRLLLGLLHPQQGTITLYNGQEKKKVDTRTRGNFVYVPQGNTLLSGTIRTNLLFGNEKATEEAMWFALEMAEAGFVRSLPQGLDTPCSEQGGGLSEGQAQRIAIARALLRPGGIFLFDEFSSALDPETEKRLVHNLTTHFEDKTMIFITHQPYITRFCDQIIRLK